MSAPLGFWICGMGCRDTPGHCAAAVTRTSDHFCTAELNPARRHIWPWHFSSSAGCCAWFSSWWSFSFAPSCWSLFSGSLGSWGDELRVFYAGLFEHGAPPQSMIYHHVGNCTPGLSPKISHFLSLVLQLCKMTILGNPPFLETPTPFSHDNFLWTVCFFRLKTKHISSAWLCIVFLLSATWQSKALLRSGLVCFYIHIHVHNVHMHYIYIHIIIHI